MLKTLLITTAVSGVIVSGAIAQSQTPTAPAPKDQSVAPKESTSAPGTKFMMAQGADQLVFTRFKGVDVRGPDNASVGSVNDLLFDGTGKIMGVVVGVGGFLGIGAKNVAIDMSALDVVPAESGNNDINNTPAGSTNDPSNVKLKVAWTKDQLQDAPDLQRRTRGTQAEVGDGKNLLRCVAVRALGKRRLGSRTGR
jgi:PRC-barrel domain